MKRLLGLLLTLVILGVATPAFAVPAQGQVNLEISGLAPESTLRGLQEEATGAWVGHLHAALDPTVRDNLLSLSVDRTPEGLSIRYQVSDPEALPALETAIRRELDALARRRSQGYSYQLRGPEKPSSPPWMPLAALFALLAAGAFALLMLLRPKLFLSLPSYAGMPVLGLFPADLGRGGKFLELQALPAQALGLVIRNASRQAPGGLREMGVMGLDDLTSSAVVTACLGLALLREKGRVLVVDLAGEESPLAEVLEEGDPLEGPTLEGTLRVTALADLDLLTGLRPLEGSRPVLPAVLIERYRWILYHAPLLQPLKDTDTVLVATGEGATRGALWAARIKLMRAGAGALGSVLVGATVPQKLRDRYMARYYFEKLKTVEEAL